MPATFVRAFPPLGDLSGLSTAAPRTRFGVSLDATVGTVSVDSGNARYSGGYAFKASPASGSAAYLRLGTTASVGSDDYIRADFKVDALPGSGDVQVLAYLAYNPGGPAQYVALAIHVDSSGRLVAYTQSSSSSALVLLATGTTTLSAGTYYTLDVFAQTHYGAGGTPTAAWGVRIGGTLEISGSADLNTQGSDATSFVLGRFTPDAGAFSAYYDNVAIGTGGYLPPGRVALLAVTGPGDLANGTGDYTTVRTDDGDTSYLTFADLSGGDASRSTFATQSCAAGGVSGTINAAGTFGIAKGGAVSVGLKSGTNYPGATPDFPLAYGPGNYLATADPSGSAWTTTSLDGYYALAASTAAGVRVTYLAKLVDYDPGTGGGGYYGPVAGPATASYGAALAEAGGYAATAGPAIASYGGSVVPPPASGSYGPSAAPATASYGASDVPPSGSGSYGPSAQPATASYGGLASALAGYGPAAGPATAAYGSSQAEASGYAATAAPSAAHYGTSQASASGLAATARPASAHYAATASGLSSHAAYGPKAAPASVAYAGAMATGTGAYGPKAGRASTAYAGAGINPPPAYGPQAAGSVAAYSTLVNLAVAGYRPHAGPASVAYAVAGANPGVDTTRVSAGPFATLDGIDWLVTWSGTLPAGDSWQVYVDRRLAWSGGSTRTRIAIPPDGGDHEIAVGAVPLTLALTDLSATLPPPSGGTGTRATLAWTGGTYLDPTIAGFSVYRAAMPGASPVTTGKPEAVVAAYPQGVTTDGFGMGGLGSGGFGESAQAYAYTTDPVPSGGAWSWAIVPFDAAGNLGPPTIVSATLSGPPAPPAADGNGVRLKLSYDPGTRTATLVWSPSPG